MTGCFDRIPDQPRSISARTLEILILIAIIDFGCLVPAVDCWMAGVDPVTNRSSFWQILAFSLLIAIGLLLIGAKAARSGRPIGLQLSDGRVSVAASRFVLWQWLRSFCLVLLLAIGPVLFALALATAQRALRYEPQFTKNAAGAESSPRTSS